MRFRRQVHDGVWLLGGEKSAYRFAIADVGFLKAMARRAFDRAQRLETAGVRQLVDVGDGIAVGDEMTHDGATDEPGAPGDQDSSNLAHLQPRLDLGEQRRRAVLFGDDQARRIDRPVDAHSGVIEADRAIMVRRISVAHLVEHLGIVLERHKPVGKAFGDEQLIPFRRGKHETRPAPECR